MTLLESTNLTVKLNHKTILNSIEFSLAGGELVGLIGANGTGKTTLLRSLAGLLPDNQHSVKYREQTLSLWDRKQLACELAYLPQGNQSFWAVTVEMLVSLGRLPHRKPWNNYSLSDDSAVKKAMQDCDLIMLAKRPVDTLSGGERARAMLARALAVEPRLLLADEPVAGLDPGHQLEVMTKLRQLADAGMGIICVIHDLSLAARYCHRLVLLGEQKILAQGRPEQVLSAKNLARGFNIRAHIGKAEGEMLVVPIACC